VERTFSWLGQNRRMSLGITRGFVRQRRSFYLRGHDPPDGEAFGTWLRISKQFQKKILGSSAYARGLASRSDPAWCELEPRGCQEKAPEGQRASRVGMSSHQKHPRKYQQDEGPSGRSSAPKRYRRRDQRNHPGTCSHYREPKDQAQLRHVLHYLEDRGLPFWRESLSLAQGIPCADACSRVVSAEEHGEDPDGPAAHFSRPPFQTIGEQVDGQGYEPDKGDLDDVEPHEPPRLLYGLGDTAWLWMEDLQDGESQRRPK
jgi:hypothetical protein